MKLLLVKDGIPFCHTIPLACNPRRSTRVASQRNNMILGVTGEYKSDQGFQILQLQHPPLCQKGIKSDTVPKTKPNPNLNISQILISILNLIPTKPKPKIHDPPKKLGPATRLGPPKGDMFYSLSWGTINIFSYP